MDGGEDLVGSGDGRMRLGSRRGVRITLLLATKVEGQEDSQEEGKGQVTHGRDGMRR